MDPKYINRINELSLKKKTEGLTQEEAEEQKKLYKAYISGYRKNMQEVLDRTYMENADGSIEKIKKRPED